MADGLPNHLESTMALAFSLGPGWIRVRRGASAGCDDQVGHIRANGSPTAARSE